MRKHQRLNTYNEERASSAAVRRHQARQPQPLAPTPEQAAALEKWAKGVHLVGAEVLSAAEYATLAQHPMISDAARTKFEAQAQSVNW